MPHDERVFVRRNRKGEIVRVMTITRPQRPGAPPPAGPPSPPSGSPRPLLQEVNPAEKEKLMRELEEQSKKR